MDFYEALRSVMDGARVTRREWSNREVYMVMNEGRLRIMNGVLGDDRLHDLILQDADITAEDWSMVADA